MKQTEKLNLKQRKKNKLDNLIFNLFRSYCKDGRHEDNRKEE